MKGSTIITITVITLFAVINAVYMIWMQPIKSESMFVVFGLLLGLGLGFLMGFFSGFAVGKSDHISEQAFLTTMNALNTKLNETVK